MMEDNDKENNTEGLVINHGDHKLLQTNNTMEGFIKMARRPLSVQIAWFILFMLTIAGCTFHFHQIISNYLEYPKVSKTQKHLLPFVFPDVSFCHPFLFKRAKGGLTVPGSQQIYRHIYERNIPSFWRLLLTGNETQANVGHNEEKVTALSLGSYLYYSAKTWSLLGPEDGFLVCFYKREKCDIRNFTVIVHPVAGYCFKFKPEDRTVYETAPESGLFLMHNGWNYIVDKLSLKSPLKSIDGLNVFINAANSWPESLEPFAVIQRTQTVVIGIQDSQYQMINTPKEPCRAEQFVKRCFLSRNGVIECDQYINDGVICRHDYYQDLLVEKCQCIMFDWLIRSEYRHKPYCLYVPDSVFEQYDRVVFMNDSVTLRSARNVNSSFMVFNIVNFMRRYQCYSRIRQLADATSATPCVPACTLNKRKDELDRYAYSPPMLNMAHSVRPIIQENLNHLNLANWSNHSYSALLERSNELASELAGNTGILEIYPIEKSVDLTSEDFRYYQSTLLSNLGGTLGLWIGCSVLSVIELIEMLVLFSNRFRNKRKQVASNLQM